MAVSFAEIVDEIRSLDQESKLELMELLHKWLMEERRNEIFQNARQSEEEFRLGQTRNGNVHDLMKDLYAED
jgi:hypothetical protein